MLIALLAISTFIVGMVVGERDKNISFPRPNLKQAK